MSRLARSALLLVACSREAASAPVSSSTAAVTTAVSSSPAPSSATMPATVTPSSVVDAALPRPAPTPHGKWWSQAHMFEDGPPMNARVPSITFCPDGRYETEVAYSVPPTFPQPQRNGMVCCHEGERGTYELEWSDAGAVVSIRLRSSTGVERTEPLGPAGEYHAAPAELDARFCH